MLYDDVQIINQLLTFALIVWGAGAAATGATARASRLVTKVFETENIFVCRMEVRHHVD